MKQNVWHAQFMERSMQTRFDLCGSQYTKAMSRIEELEKAPKCTTVTAEPAVPAEDEATSAHAIPYAQSRPSHAQIADDNIRYGRRFERVWLGAANEPEPAVKPAKAKIVDELSWDLEECNDQKDPLCKLRRMINSRGDDIAAEIDHLSVNGRARDFGAEVARKMLDDSDCDEHMMLDSHLSAGKLGFAYSPDAHVSVKNQREPQWKEDAQFPRSRTLEQNHHKDELLDQLEKLKRHNKHRDNKDGKKKKRDAHKKKGDKSKQWREEEESMDEKHRKYYDDANFIQRVQTIHRQLN